MNLKSLGFRLFLLSVISILAALIATTFALNAQFHQYFQDRIYSELEQHLEQLTTNLSLDDDGEIFVEPLLDRRFAQPFSGLYWQVQDASGQEFLSRSLWGNSFEVPADSPPGRQFRTTAQSPVGSTLLVAGWLIIVGEGENQSTVVLSVGIDNAEVTVAADGFRSYLIGWLTLMFAGLLLAAGAQVRIGLAPLKVLRQRIEKIRSGAETRMEGRFPSEVQPLVDEVNELLELHNSSLEDARTRASDLAHGLKTPLTIMRTLAQDLAADGQDGKAAEIETQITSMHHFIERELARVNINIRAGSPVPAAPVIARMVASMKKLPNGPALKWTLEIADDLTTPLDEHDLSELIGNLLDNARKWAAGRVVIRAQNTSSNAGWIHILDDGPGIPQDMYSDVIKRGGRLDASIAGSGLGLAITADLVTQMNGQLSLSKSEFGGLEVAISW